MYYHHPSQMFQITPSDDSNIELGIWDDRDDNIATARHVIIDIKDDNDMHDQCTCDNYDNPSALLGLHGHPPAWSGETEQYSLISLLFDNIIPCIISISEFCLVIWYYISSFNMYDEIAHNTTVTKIMFWIGFPYFIASVLIPLYYGINVLCKRNNDHNTFDKVQISPGKCSTNFIKSLCVTCAKSPNSLSKLNIIYTLSVMLISIPYVTHLFGLIPNAISDNINTFNNLTRIYLIGWSIIILIIVVNCIMSLAVKIMTKLR
jgi:hypothetical protein